jgi:2,4-dienoyl-CoA reductase-like NADH-dependent reductase (Old Yellow Enzyme family)
MISLFTPLTIREVLLKNRIVVSPMCQYSAIDGVPNDWHLVHLGSHAVGGAGAVIVEATAVSPEGRISPGDLGLWNEEQLSWFARINQFVETQGSVPGIQLAHAGRKASHQRPWDGGHALLPGEGNWQTLAPSAIPFKESDPAPRAMDRNDIEKLLEDFKAAARRALAAGFRIIEIHAAHGYLLNEFLSPISNQRTDEYGGSFENRVRLIIQVIDSVRQVWPTEFPLFIRISATDWVEGGWTIDDSVRLASLIKNKEVDLVDCSSGGLSPLQQIPASPLYQVPFAERIKKESGILTGAVGLINTAQEAEQVVADGKADLVFMARQLLRDPYFPLHAAKELGVDVPWPVQYLRAKR